MTTTDTAPAGALDRLDLTVLRDLQRRIGEANADKGFHDEGSLIREITTHAHNQSIKLVGVLASIVPGLRSLEAALLRNYATARLALITTEVAEAIEEVRNGRAIDETYYPTERRYEGNTLKNPMSNPPYKPEGVPSELADVVIRAFDFAHEFKIDLAAMIDEKLAYNATRGHKHGKKF